MFSLTNSNQAEVVILIDVGNGTTTGAIAVFKKNEKPTYVYVAKRFFIVTEKVDPARLETEMNLLLDEMLTMLTQKGFEHKYWLSNKKKINKVLISFSSPWYTSKTKSIHLQNEKEFVITNDFLDNIMKNEVTLLKKELNSENSLETYEVIEKSIVHSKINGYILDSSIGKSTKSFDASLYMSFVGEKFINDVLKTIYKHTHINEKDIIINTFPLISFTVIRDLFAENPDFMIVDITGEVTDITLVRGDIILDTVSIPSGRNFILRQISKTFNYSNEIAESTLRLHTAKKLDETQTTKMTEIVDSIEKEWLIYFENALIELSPDMNLPNNIFLTADTDTASLYMDFLNKGKSDATSIYRRNIKITHIDLDKTSSFYNNISGYLLDEFVVLLGLFYKKISEHN